MNNPIKKQVLRDQIITYLSEKIIHGEYKPGDRIVETQIAKDLGVSQAPVREALRTLEAMGSVKTLPYKGTFVSQLTTKDFKDLLLVRAELDALAVRLAIPRFTSQQLTNLDQVLQDMYQACRNNDLHALIRSDLAFHEIILEASDNDFIIKIQENLSYKYWTHFGMHKFSVQMSLEHEASRHKPLFEAIIVRDIPRADTLMREHFLELITLLG